jgi:hypothetical protein
MARKPHVQTHRLSTCWIFEDRLSLAGREADIKSDPGVGRSADERDGEEVNPKCHVVDEVVWSARIIQRQARQILKASRQVRHDSRIV